MPTNSTSNNIDFVPPTQYLIPLTWKQKKPSPCSQIQLTNLMVVRTRKGLVKL